MGVAQAMEMLPAAPPLRAEEHEQLKAVVLDIADIQPYEHNPRRAAHAEYGRIKASIRADGLEQPLVVTRRPGEPDYRLHAGGNTRLKILKELFAETGERRFARLACWYRAWRDEAEVVLAHLKENDLRGDLIFRDKALAVANAERWLVGECGEKLTQARLAEMLAGRGYPLSQGLISQMKYAVERLLPVMPKALEAGLGRRQAMRIRSLDRVARALWLECTPDPEADYDNVFGELCRRYDAPEWEIGQLRRGLEAEIAEQAEVSIHAVSFDLDAGLAGRPFGATAGDEEEQDEWDDWDGRGATAAQAGGLRETAGDKGGGGDRPAAGAGVSAADGLGPDRETVAFPEAGSVNGTEPGAPPSNGEAHDTPLDGAGPGKGTMPGPAAGGLSEVPGGAGGLEALRERLWRLASGLAERNGLGGLVRRLPGTGTGFVVCDVPDPALAEQLEEEELAQVSLVWWHLAACAEITVAPREALLGELPADSMLYRVLAEGDPSALFGRVWTQDPGQNGYRLWRTAGERDWRDLLGLMAAYRALHRGAMAEHMDLWKAA